MKIMHRIFRIVLGILMFPLAILLGIYMLVIAPGCWVLFGNNTISYLKEKYSYRYANYVFYGKWEN